jgi:hypothetical protein
MLHRDGPTIAARFVMRLAVGAGIFLTRCSSSDTAPAHLVSADAGCSTECDGCAPCGLPDASSQDDALPEASVQDSAPPDAAPEGGPGEDADAAPDAVAVDSSADACSIDACQNFCPPLAPFAPADPVACGACLQSKCPGRGTSYVNACTAIFDCVCNCEGYDDSCTNTLVPYVECEMANCSTECARAADAGGDR